MSSLSSVFPAFQCVTAIAGAGGLASRRCYVSCCLLPSCCANALKQVHLQALRETYLPEPPTYVPNWPADFREQAAQADGEIVLTTQDPASSAQQAHLALQGARHGC